MSSRTPWRWTNGTRCSSRKKLSRLITVEESAGERSKGTPAPVTAVANSGTGSRPFVRMKTGISRSSMRLQRCARVASVWVLRYSVSLAPTICARPGLM